MLMAGYVYYNEIYKRKTGTSTKELFFKNSLELLLLFFGDFVSQLALGLDRAGPLGQQLPAQNVHPRIALDLQMQLLLAVQLRVLFGGDQLQEHARQRQSISRLGPRLIRIGQRALGPVQHKPAFLEALVYLENKNKNT